MKANIRKYLPSDRSACIAIFKSNCPQYFDPEELDGLEIWLDGQDEGVIKYKTSAADHFYVFEHEGAVVACGGFYIVKDKPVANMVWGMVHNSYHKQGFGRQLFLHRVEQVALLYPAHAVLLDTSQHTYPFFERLGFVVTKITKDGYGVGLDRYDMEKG